MTRIDDCFARLTAARKKAFVAYIMAGDPDQATSLAVMQGLPAAGVDIIELGLPFTDPMADGQTIQLAGQRALDGGMTLDRTLQMVRDFRAGDTTTTTSSSDKVRFTVEMAAGWYARAGVKVGDKVDLVAVHAALTARGFQAKRYVP